MRRESAPLTELRPELRKQAEGKCPGDFAIWGSPDGNGEQRIIDDRFA